MITPSERPLTQHTPKRPVPAVLAIMSRQFVRPCKLPPTPRPRADIGLLSAVCACVSLEVGTLGVRLATAEVGAAVGGDGPPGAG